MTPEVITTALSAINLQAKIDSSTADTDSLLVRDAIDSERHVLYSFKLTKFQGVEGYISKDDVVTEAAHKEAVGHKKNKKKKRLFMTCFGKKESDGS